MAADSGAARGGAGVAQPILPFLSATDRIEWTFVAANRENARTAQGEKAGAGAFETDFWKDANLRKVWDEIVPGEPRKTIPCTLTREAIALYCKAVGETNPLYLDEDAAKAGPWGGLIAPPAIHIMLMFSCTPADDWMRSPGTVNAGQSWSYNIPVRPGDTIRPSGIVRAKQVTSKSRWVTIDGIVRNQNDVPVATGEAMVEFP